MEHNNKIFIVDDSVQTQKVLTSHLNDLDSEIICFTSPQDALQAVEQEDPYLILLDYLMPEMNGDDFMVKFSERLLFGNRIVLMITSKNFSDEECALLHSVGISQIINKSMVKDQLLDIIRKYKEA